jgi:hypothetical protein
LFILNSLSVFQCSPTLFSMEEDREFVDEGRSGVAAELFVDYAVDSASAEDGGVVPESAKENDNVDEIVDEIDGDGARGGDA